VYAIDGRGRVFTDAFGLTGKLAEAGVDTKAIEVNRVFPSGKVVNARQVVKDEARVVYWLPVSDILTRVGTCNYHMYGFTAAAAHVVEQQG
jgi:hypothetical protein